MSVAALAAGGALAAAEPAPGSNDATVSGQPVAARVAAICAEHSRDPWPNTITGRRALISELQVIRPQCMNDALFLAVLGALLLEEGNAEQALVWLERSLLLDPDSLGARVDHALALAALGQPSALQEIAQLLRHRSDVPAALRARLYPLEARSAFALPPARLGHPSQPNWGTAGEISLLAGYEGNLDRSPRLSELTLTFPDGPLVFPVESRSRSGAATLAAAAFQVAYAPHPAAILRTGAILAARGAASERTTDWRQWQWSSSVTHSRNGVRAQLEFSISGVGGPLGEPYTLRRLAASAEAAALTCRTRLTFESERRLQSRTTTLDSLTGVWLASLQCPLHNSWHWLLDVRSGLDRPRSTGRPGGPQRTGGAGLRIAGLVFGDVQLELGARGAWSRDRDGYNILLENNAPRRTRLRQLSLEVSAPLHRFGDYRLEAVLKWQGAAQTSNLPLFRYRADSVYTGVRWLW